MKKYRVIAKVEDQHFVKYHVNNLLLFTNFLDTSFPSWRWFNVYDSQGVQIENYTKSKRPLQKTVVQ